MCGLLIVNPLPEHADPQLQRLYDLPVPRAHRHKVVVCFLWLTRLSRRMKLLFAYLDSLDSADE